MADMDTGDGAAAGRPDAEALTERIREGAERAWALLVEASDRRVWEAMGYGSWDDYLVSEFDPARSDAYRLVERARVLPSDEAEDSDVALTESEAQSLVNQVVLSLEALTMGLDLVDVSTLPKDPQAAGVVTEALETFRRFRDGLAPEESGPA